MFPSIFNRIPKITKRKALLYGVNPQYLCNDQFVQLQLPTTLFIFMLKRKLTLTLSKQKQVPEPS